MARGPESFTARRTDFVCKKDILFNLLHFPVAMQLRFVSAIQTYTPV